jgi:SAM-dependent methyltransferase
MHQGRGRQPPRHRLLQMQPASRNAGVDATPKAGRAPDASRGWSHNHPPMHPNLPDQWLDHWLADLRSAAAGSRVLELGCDTGHDTVWLVEHGFSVVATDLSLDALATAAAQAPGAACMHHDLREAMPFASGSFGAVIASLCLHYFDWATTAGAVSEIRRCLSPSGLFLCRLNSVRDELHGAGQGEEIEPRFYRQDARYAASKRFFAGEDLDRLFPGTEWRELNRREVTIHRYAKPKVAWELALVPA